MTEQDWFELEELYRNVFGSGILRLMLPQDEEAAAELVREAIKLRDDKVLELDIPRDALI